MGIDRHEWEHRNYKSGRDKAAPMLQGDDELDPLAVDASLGAGDASLQPEISKGKAKDSVKAAPKDSKTNAKTKSGGKRPARAG